MRNRFTLFLMLMFLMATGMNAQNVDVVARMQTLAGAATNSDATKATVSTVWQSDDAEGAVYEFSNGKYLGAISNADVVNALEGDKYVTIAMWVYGRTTSNQCVFGYGNHNDGVKFQQNGKSISATTKGVRDIGGWSKDELLDDEWNLIAFAVAGKTNTNATTGKYYINNINDNHSGLKLSDMVTPDEGNKLLAIGSGNQNTARETYNGMIANLTVITSDDLLTNDQIKTYVGTVSRIDGKRRVTINYNYGSGTFSQKILVTPSSTFDVPTPDFYTNVSPATITDDNSSTSYNVTCVENFPFTAGTFCKLKLREKDTEITTRYVVWDGTSANIKTRKSEEEARNAGMGSYWRFERVPNTENQVRLFTNCKGKSQAVTFTDMATNEQAATLTDNGTIFVVKTGNSEYTDPKGFRLSSLTNDDYNVNDVNGTLSVWANGLSKTDGGSTFTVYNIDAQPTEVTSATCTDENGISATYSIASKGYYWNGTASNAVSAPVLPGYMAATTASITAEGALSFNYTNNYPFVVSTDNAKYFQSLRVRNDASHYLTATYNNSVTEGTTKSRNNDIGTDAVKQQVMQSGWAFVKEPGTFNKFRIYNEATGNLQLYLPNENNSTAATMAETGTAFVVELQPKEFTTFTGGFTIRVNEDDSHALGDHGDGALAYWCNHGSSELNNDGSIFRVADADVYIESICTQMCNNSKTWVAKLNNQNTASVTAFTTAATELENLIPGTSSNANKMQAYRKLAQAYYRVKHNLLNEAGNDQNYRLKSTAFNDAKYMSVENANMGGIKAIDLNNKVKKQLFTFLPRTDDAEAGKFEIGNASDSKVIALSSWNVAMNANQGSGVPFTITYIGNDLYTITQTKFTNGGNYFAPGELVGSSATIYNNQGVNCGRIHWVLEPVSSAELHFIDNCEALSAAITAAEPYENFYDADKAGLPGYLSEANQSIAESVNNYISTGRQQLEYATESTLDYIFTGAITTINDNVALLKNSLANFPASRYFSIKNAGADNRGYITYQPDATKADDGTEYIWTTAMTSATAFNAGNTNHLWCFLNHTKVNGTTEHYLYNVGLKKYARPTKEYGRYDYTWIFSDEPAPITFHHLDGHKMAITAKSAEVASDTEVYASVSTGYTGPVISYYAQGDGGVPFTFDWGTVEFAASDTTAVAALVRTPITLRTVAKDANPLITGLDDNQSICTYSSTKAFRVPAGVTAYYATRRDDNNIVRLKAVPDGIVPANEGVLLVGAVNKTKAMLDVDYRTEVTAESNIFLNTASGETPMGANCYVLANSTNGIGFYHAIEGTNLSQGKAYLDFSGSPVRAFTLSFGDDGPTTGISSINADGNAENAPVYDLSGRRIAQPSGRGIYIKNGKKYFVK